MMPCDCECNDVQGVTIRCYNKRTRVNAVFYDDYAGEAVTTEVRTVLPIA